MSKFISHGREYEIDEAGAIHQLDARPFTYDGKYVSTYETPAYTAQSDILQGLRLGYVLGTSNGFPEKLIDFGYGNGAFLKMAARYIPEVCGYDVTDIDLGPDIRILEKLEPCDVITFWDALEHVADWSFLRDLDCHRVVISLPMCHFPRYEKQEWFDTKYIHRKPDEHLHHFDPYSLTDTMKKFGWSNVSVSMHEDIIRVSKHGGYNILTAAFKKTGKF